MLPEYEERLDILAWNIQVQHPELMKYSEEIILEGLRRLKERPSVVSSKRARNFKIFVLRYQYRTPYARIGRKNGITTQRVMQLVRIEMRALKYILSEI